MKRAKMKRLAPGKYFRAFKGRTFHLLVEQDGKCRFKSHGKIFSSPTAAAQFLTNHSTSGPYFWDEDYRRKLDLEMAARRENQK